MAKRKHIRKKVRDELLVDAMHRCCLCLEHHDIIEMHHIVPISEGGLDTEENLIAVCPTCHAKIHRLPRHYTVEQLRMYKERWARFCALGLPLDARLAQALDHTKPPEATHILPPLQPYFAHPYPLEANFTGRAAERRMLTSWFTDPDGQKVLVLEAMGGMGKSAVTWFWVQNDLLGTQLPWVPTDDNEAPADCAVPETDRPEGIMWWSFYDSQAGFPTFLEHALAYCGGGQVQAQTGLAGVQQLLGLLQQRPILLVLDGFERELQAYAGLNAAYRGDQVDPQKNHRASIHPCAGAFLRGIASPSMAGWILITTRLMPQELQGHDGRPFAACRHEELRRFRLDDVVAFFRAEGIDGTRSEVEDACGKWGYHPLAVRLLAGAILHDLKRPGDVTVAQDYDVSDELVPREHNILKIAYDALSRPLQDLLSRLAAFRSPVAYDAIRAVATIKAESKLKAALRELIERGLLFPAEGQATPPGPVRYDMHPIIRRYAYARLGGKETVHAQLRDYFDAVPKPDEEKIEKLDDLAPTIELYHHTVRAGRYDEASELFRDRLAEPLYYRFGAYQTRIELLRGLFPDGEDKPPRLKDERDQSWTLTALGNSYSLSGRPRLAVTVFELGNEIKERRGDKTNLAIGLVNLAFQLIELGDLNPAEANYRRSIDLCREVEDEFREAVGHTELGRLLSLTGLFDEARTELDAAWRTFEEQKQVQFPTVVASYRALRALLMHDHPDAVFHACSARELYDRHAAGAFPVERDFVRAEWLLGVSKVALGAERPGEKDSFLAEAEGHLTEALTRCRRISMVEMEANILLAWAEWHAAKGDAASARRTADEALAIADRCEYRLQQADAHNMLARLALDEGDRDGTRRHAEIAHERALCDGPPDHTYKPALEQADKLLAEIG